MLNSQGRLITFRGVKVMVDNAGRLSYNEALSLFRNVDKVTVQRCFDITPLNILGFNPEQNTIRSFIEIELDSFNHLFLNLSDYFLDMRNITDEELTMFYMLHPEANNNHFHIFFEKLLTLRTETV